MLTTPAYGTAVADATIARRMKNFIFRFGGDVLIGYGTQKQFMKLLEMICGSIYTQWMLYWPPSMKRVFQPSRGKRSVEKGIMGSDNDEEKKDKNQCWWWWWWEKKENSLLLEEKN